MTDNTSRPRPLRLTASIVGGLLALVSGLVGSGLITDVQGSATTGAINAAVALLAAFGVAVVGERRVTPVADPRDSAGQSLLPLSRNDIH
ncbi:hypothetical protein NLX83_13685 [Allokutzneria sp. A3M-2-11 16]|uniref:hypothetical protein n=1 Tax=Allokutzneria sp. A3M-2-11 16 TaxID=2962043 RepID=UPI0020B7643B|nr:hypothetical protein [Allokutzneria sp. A3M-2-11 16]MCP3800310.1 hypothetical protein [Allokutzneria sp. A3M-2-11 16]